MKTIRTLNPFRSLGVFSVAALALNCMVAPIQAQNPFSKSKADLETRIGENRIRLEERQVRPGQAIPAQVLKNARGLIIMHQVKAGLVIGAELGNGVALVKDSKGKWSPPAFVSLGKGSFGLQIGASESVSFLVLMTDESLRLLKGGGAGSAGVALKAADGPLGVGGDIGSVSTRQPVLVYSNVDGAFAGATLETGAVVGAKKKNATVYGLTLEQILFTGKAEVTPAGKQLVKVIEKYSGASAK